MCLVACLLVPLQSQGHVLDSAYTLLIAAAYVKACFCEADAFLVPIQGFLHQYRNAMMARRPLSTASDWNGSKL